MSSAVASSAVAVDAASAVLGSAARLAATMSSISGGESGEGMMTMNEL